MDAEELLTQLCHTIDAHDWEGLGPLLHEEFTCHYVHTGETLDKTSWIRLNAEYPGFERLTVEDLVANGNRAVARCHVSGTDEGKPAHFEVASFVSVRDGRIAAMTEVWTDVGQVPAGGTRPAD